ncbi:(3aS,4S,5R,7aS)-5-hydroxy-7a-methyl-1-oxo-octahydro-1H-indene-4-carboxyl-CoA dehydrogenase-like [Zingiber officinale]|nr:(3aS,4S,5R,7aS)-5-hydroxy-7a-methyl-1-oxo-octahydro-1H-indene-4-carboxyl-CoA dehydrogenase-like [Zingiber officinale]
MSPQPNPSTTDRWAMGWRGILGFEYGIVQAPLGPDISGPELVAAVANAGAIGLLRAPDWEAPDHLRDLIQKTRTLTDKPFGVGMVLSFPHKENLKVVLEEKVAILQVYWGEFPKELVSEAHLAGVKVIHQVGSFEEAKKAKCAGVDAIIVQGREAGGHVIGQDGLISLLPRVVDLVSDCDITVIAAGGIVDARGYVAALILGAHGVCLGTRFLATHESFAHPYYKQKLLEYNETNYTNVFGRSRWPGAPHRVLRTPFYTEWRHFPDDENEENQPVIGHSVIHGVPKEIHRFAGTIPNATTTGDLDCMVMYAGEGVGMIKEILPAAEVLRKLIEEAQQIIQQKFSHV